MSHRLIGRREVFRTLEAPTSLSGGEFTVSEIQSILSEDSALILTEVGYEKLRYVGGGALVATSNDSKYISLESEADKLAKKMLEN